MMSDNNLKTKQTTDAKPQVKTTSFDLNLDRWNKIFTIVVGVLGLLVSAYVTIFVIWPGHNRDNAKACFDTENEILVGVKNYPNGDITTHINSLRRICDTSHDEAEAKVKTLVAIAKALPRSDNVTGYVSLGPENNYADSNFRNFLSDEKALKHLDALKKDAILKARWSVNLRTNTEDTDSDQNPSLAIIYDNECVKMEEDLPQDTIRGSHWVKVSLSKCK